MGARNQFKRDSDDVLFGFINQDYLDGKEPPTQKELATRLHEYREKQSTNENEPYDIISAQSTTSRALQKLLKARRIIKKGKTYVPYTIQDERIIIKKKILDEVTFSREKTFTLSDTAMIVPVSPPSMLTAKELFKKYLGDNDCYDVLELNGYLLILLNWNDDGMVVQNQDVSPDEKDNRSAYRKKYLKTLRKQIKEIVEGASAIKEV